MHTESLLKELKVLNTGYILQNLIKCWCNTYDKNVCRDTRCGMSFNLNFSSLKKKYSSCNMLLYNFFHLNVFHLHWHLAGSL